MPTRKVIKTAVIATRRLVVRPVVELHASKVAKTRNQLFRSSVINSFSIMHPKRLLTCSVVKSYTRYISLECAHLSNEKCRPNVHGDFHAKLFPDVKLENFVKSKNFYDRRTAKTANVTTFVFLFYFSVDECVEALLLTGFGERTLWCNTRPVESAISAERIGA